MRKAPTKMGEGGGLTEGGVREAGGKLGKRKRNRLESEELSVGRGNGISKGPGGCTAGCAGGAKEAALKVEPLERR